MRKTKFNLLSALLQIPTKDFTVCISLSLFFICLFFVSSGNEMQFFPSRGKCEVRMK